MKERDSCKKKASDMESFAHDMESQKTEYKNIVKRMSAKVERNNSKNSFNDTASPFNFLSPRSRKDSSKKKLRNIIEFEEELENDLPLDAILMKENN